MLRNFKETSIACSTLRYFYIKYNYVVNIYKDSSIYLWRRKISKVMRACFRYSFLVIIAQIKEERDFTLIDNSMLVQRMVDLFRKYKSRFIHFFTTSRLMNFAHRTKEEVCFSSVNTISIIVIIAIITHTSLSIILKRGIALWDWLLRGLFIFLAVNLLSYRIDWQTLRQNSVILKLISKK